MDLGPHAGFIVTAYAAAIAIVAGLIVWVVLDRRRLTRAVDELEAKGITRRSGETRKESPKAMPKGMPNGVPKGTS
jgi:heme exporter protein D